MAIQFDETDDFFSISDAASLTLQDGDWCIGIWTYVADNTGELYQYLLSNNGIGAANSFNLYLNEEDEANPDKWVFRTEDGDGTDLGNQSSTTAPGADSKWRLIIIQRDESESEVQMWFCEPGATASKEASVADTNFGAVNGGDWNIGRRVVGGSDGRYYGGIACEFFKGNFCLTQAEITALGTGLRPHDLGYTSDVYLEMFTADATLRDMFNSNDAARNSTPTSVNHMPTMKTPRGPVFNDSPSLY